MSLRMVTLRRLECDNEECDNKTDVTSSDGIQARFEAAALGWRYEAKAVPGSRGKPRRYDYCPDHAAEVE